MLATILRFQHGCGTKSDNYFKFLTTRQWCDFIPCKVSVCCTWTGQPPVNQYLSHSYALQFYFPFSPSFPSNPNLTCDSDHWRLETCGRTNLLGSERAISDAGITGLFANWIRNLDARHICCIDSEIIVTIWQMICTYNIHYNRCYQAILAINDWRTYISGICTYELR